MPGPANDQSLNLKHRLTGAVILIGIAVAVMSLLLDSGDPAAVPPPASSEQPQESFVSRIVSDEDGETRVPAPTTAPDDNAGQGASVDPSEAAPTAPADAEPGRAAVKVPEAATTEPSLQVEPVLEPATVLSAPAPKINTVEAEPAIDENAEEAPRPARQGETVASAPSWVVRVGAFSEKANADSISQRLHDGGYSPSSVPVTVNGKSMVRVWVGPYPDRKTAVRAKSDLSRDFDLNGFVARKP